MEQSIAGGVVNADADLCSGDMDGISLRSEVRLGAKAAAGIALLSSGNMPVPLKVACVVSTLHADVHAGVNRAKRISFPVFFVQP